MLQCEVADKTELLLQPERQYLSNAVAKRRNEFSTGRWLMREGLKALGEPPVAICKGRFGEPDWPAGIVGSLSHSGLVCALLIARSVDLIGVGIDIEASESDIGDAADFILTNDEATEFRSTRELRRIFSAKEAIYKCLFPTSQEFLDFHDISIRLDHQAKTFSAYSNSDKLPTGLVESGGGVFEEDETVVATLFTIGRNPTSNAT